MSCMVKELKDWLDTLDNDDPVGIDDGGLTLRAPGSWFEIGGIPIEEDEEDDE